MSGQGNGDGLGSRSGWFLVGLVLGLVTAGALAGSFALAAQGVLGVAGGFALYVVAVWTWQATSRGRRDASRRSLTD